MEHCGVFSGMGLQPLPLPVFKRKARGRGQGQRRQVYRGSPETPATEKLADIHLRPVGGTDGALALGMANILIENGWIDRDYIERYVSGLRRSRVRPAV